jgi:hypothetical protein
MSSKTKLRLLLTCSIHWLSEVGQFTVPLNLALLLRQNQPGRFNLQAVMN